MQGVSVCCWRGDQAASSSCGWHNLYVTWNYFLLSAVMQWKMGTALCCILLGSAGCSSCSSLTNSPLMALGPALSRVSAPSTDNMEYQHPIFYHWGKGDFFFINNPNYPVKRHLSDLKY